MADPSPTHPPRRAAPWYADGLRFECLPDCGRCCTRHDDFAYVYLEPSDVRALASFLGMSAREFRKRWTFREEGHTALRIEGEACPFLEGWRCAVYAARPGQCRTFPFWREILRTPGGWEQVGRFCPGVGRGELLSVATIRSKVRDEP
jgi:Fe-S-cluster containining protein